MSQKSLNILSYIIKGGVFILPALSLIVSGNLFFPFITGKAFFFRIIVEILFFLWIFLCVFDKKYRPKKSPLLFALAAVVLVLTLATIFGENPSRSFWSNYERMEGLVSHLHLFAYFFILSGVFRKEKDYKWLFAAMLAVSVAISVYAYMQFLGRLEVHQGGTKLDATMGNSTYLAIFIVFHLFIISWMIYKYKNIFARAALAFLFIFEAPIIYYTMTRGAILGFFGGLIIFAGFMIFFSKNKKVRLSFSAALVLLLTAIGIFMSARNTNFVKSRPTLNKIASISLKEQTVESRFTIWKMGYEGFKENPILGWGPENFNLVFNKFYKPNMWKQEPWFDRAHNIIFDWLISAGILGFLAYWSMFTAALYMIWKRYLRDKKNISATEPILFTSLFAAYSFHNLFVFDNLTSYFMFFSILGFIQTVYYEKQDQNLNNSRVSVNDINIGSYVLLTAVFILAVMSLYMVNLKPYLAGKEIIASLREASQGAKIQNVLDNFDRAISYRTFGTPEAREQLSGFATNAQIISQISEDDKLKILNKSIQEMEYQVKAAPNDARYHLFLGSLYTRANRNNDALGAINKALELSPKKQQIFYVLADIYLSKGENQKALELMKTAYELDKSNTDAAKNLAVVLVLDKKEKEAEDILREKFGKEIVADKMLVNAYARIDNYSRVKEIWQEIIKTEDTAQNHVSLAASYLKLEERENAVKELEKAIELNPEFKQQGEYFINEIKSGRNP